MDIAWVQLQTYIKTYTSSPLSLICGSHLSSSSSSPHLYPDGRIEGVWARAAFGSVLDGRSEGMGATGGGCCSPAWPRGIDGCCARGHGGPKLLRLEPRARPWRAELLRGHGGWSSRAAMTGRSSRALSSVGATRNGQAAAARGAP